MRVTVLDTFKEGDATGVLCRTNLYDYISDLPKNYEEYFIQRGIVTNKYLDRIWETVAQSKHIPQIVLVSDDRFRAVPVGNEFGLGIQLKILDGLQRTKRLKIIFDAVQFIEGKFEDDGEVSPARVARKWRLDLQKIECSQSLFAAILETKRTNERGFLKSLLKETRIGLEVWFGLSTEQQIQKMLILNAGHKSVNIKHQIELLFFNYLPILQRHMLGIEIIREKDTSTIIYSKKREAGQFHFAHLISAFVSLHDGRAVTTNSDFSVSQSFADPTEDEYLDVDESLIADFAETIAGLDRAFHDPDGIKWIGREVVLVGLFGAIGHWADESDTSRVKALAAFCQRLPEFRQLANLTEFERQRNSLELSKVNIGNKNKRAVFDGVLLFLSQPKPVKLDWRQLFRAGER